MIGLVAIGLFKIGDGIDWPSNLTPAPQKTRLSSFSTVGFSNFSIEVLSFGMLCGFLPGRNLEIASRTMFDLDCDGVVFVIELDEVVIEELEVVNSEDGDDPVVIDDGVVNVSGSSSSNTNGQTALRTSGIGEFSSNGLKASLIDSASTGEPKIDLGIDGKSSFSPDACSIARRSCSKSGFSKLSSDFVSFGILIELRRGSDFTIMFHVFFDGVGADVGCEIGCKVDTFDEAVVAFDEGVVDGSFDESNGKIAS